MLYKIIFQPNSKGYPQFGLHCPAMPNTNPPKAGTYSFIVGEEYVVNEPTLKSLRQQIVQMPPYMRPHCNMNALPIAGSATVAGALLTSANPTVRSGTGAAIVDPTTAEVSALTDELANELNQVPEEEQPPEELAELTDEDVDLVNVEVNKLHGLHPKDAEILMINLVENQGFPKLLKTTYLEQAIADGQVSKTNKTKAKELLKQLGE